MTEDALSAKLASIVGAMHVKTDAVDIEPVLTDWRRRYHGSLRAMVLPASTEEVAAVVKLCADEGIPIVPQGGNTGLVGGATPDGSGRAVMIKTSRMTKIEHIDPIANTITAQSGVVLSDLQQAARAQQRLFPLSLASEGSCTLGGNLSTNAGGTAVLRYGNTRELCLNVEAVLADGSIIGSKDGELHGLRKDNTGLALSQLMIGAEGTLGIITRAVMKLYPLPLAQVTALAAVPDPQAALHLLALAHRQCGATLTAFELINHLAIELVVKHFDGCRYPFAEPHAFVVLMEISDHDDEGHAMAMLEKVMADGLEAGLIEDALVAQNQTQSKAFWALRENVSEAQAAEGTNIKHDISIPIGYLAAFVAQTDAALVQAFPGVRMVNFGHLGDGNLHYNVSPALGQSDSELVAMQKQINQVVYDAVERFHGSISAEHGIGQLKREALKFHRSAADLAAMRQIKAALDPRGLMNPGKML
jgi:D-lactate dehydrogenase (cytochrome)